MAYNPEIHHRRSIRLKGYDYSQEGLYFITICVQDRICLFGKIAVGAKNLLPDDLIAEDLSPLLPQSEHPIMKLNDAGKIAEQCWLAIPQHFQHVLLHEYVVMPNHIHGIIEIIENVGTNTGANYGRTDVGANDHSPDGGLSDVGAKNISPDIDVSDGGAKNISPLTHPKCCHRVKNISPLPQSPSHTIGSIVRGFKIGVTKWFDQSVWQRNYYEHIIRSTDEYERIANYIINNPAKWFEDKFFN